MVNTDLCDKYGVSVAETEMSLLVNNVPGSEEQGKTAVFRDCLS